MQTERPEVLLISSWYPTRINPTLGNFVEKHAESIALYANVNVLHVCFDPNLKKGNEYQIEVRDRMNVYRIYLKKCGFSIPGITALIRLIRIIRNYKKGFKKIYPGNKKPDIIHANILYPSGLIAYYFRKTKKIPYVITEHWTGYLQENASIKNKCLQKKIAARAAAIAPVTENLAAAMQSFSLEGNYVAIPNVVDTSLFQIREEKTSLVKRILHISTLDDRQKNFSGIIKALAEIKKTRDDFMLDVISEGDFCKYQPGIRDAGLQDQIKFHGLQKTAKVARIMGQCDFLLLFSNFENFPCVIAEAMSCGLPVLSTDVGGISEHINETNGILIRKQDAEALVKQLHFMLDHCRGYNAESIREYAVSNFSYEVVGKKYSALYNSVLKR